MTPADFLRPIGRLDAELMGGQVAAEATLTALILAAEEQTTLERAQACWVYWRAFQQLADDTMTSDPAMQRDRNKTDQFSAEQLAHFGNVAREYERCFQAATRPSGFALGTTVQKEVTPTW